MSTLVETSTAHDEWSEGIDLDYYYKMPVGPPYYQLIDHELYMSPSPYRRHQGLVTRMLLSLGAYVEERGLGEIYVAPSDVELLGQHVLQPDIYFVSTERRHILTDQGVSGAPDLIVEILSPSTARLDLGRKKELYKEAGGKEMWAVHPGKKTVQIFRFESGEETSVTLDEKAELTTPLLPGFSLLLAKVFR